MEKTILVINRQSRADALNQPSAQPEEIVDMLKSLNVNPELHWVEPSELSDVLKQIADKIPKRVFVGGGDGTLNAAASVFADTETVMGILPLGTFNHLAKDLQIPMGLEDAVHTLVYGKECRIDLGQMNDKIFVNHASVGIYPHAVRKRKVYQRSLGVGRLPAMGYALLEALFRQPVLTLDLRHKDERQHLKTPFVFVGNNRFETSPFSFIRRQTLDEGHLHILHLPQLSAFAYLKIALSVMVGRLRSAPELHQDWQTEMTIASRKKHLKVSLDGEIFREATPLKFRSRPKALRVLVPSEVS